MENQKELPKLFSFGGFSTGTCDKKYQDVFDVVYDDASTALITKEIFHHEEEDLTFDYKYAIEIRDNEEADDRAFDISVELFVIPKSLHSKVYEEVKKFAGECDEKSIVDYGYVAPMAYELVLDPVPDGTCVSFVEMPVIVEKLDIIANLLPGIDIFRGFSLDQPFNKMGTTGWNMILMCVNNVPLFIRRE